MALLSRCPACTTLFRVVTDQLRVSQGWVKCGQCGDIFDASQHLLEVTLHSELEALSTAPTLDVSPAAQPSASEAAATSLAQAPSTDLPDSGGNTMPTEDQPPQALPEDSHTPEVLEGGVAPTSDGVRAGSDASPREPLDGASQASALEAESAVSALAIVAPVHAAQEVDTPVQGQNSAKPRPETPSEDVVASEPTPPGEMPAWGVPHAAPPSVRTPWRLGPGLWLVVGSVLAALQALAWQRDVLVAWHPTLDHVLKATCQALGCRIQPLRRLAAIEVEQASLAQRAPGTYSLQAVVRNASALRLAMPALELTLTDTQGAPVIRRVLRADELKAPSELTANQRWTVDATLSIDPAVTQDRVSGYQVLAFYP
ncbi:MAG: hypothetical protein Fur007_00230 [Rhodoferax sp.]